ncbi:MFS transporter [Flagellimonas sp. 2504JD4-2]
MNVQDSTTKVKIAHPIYNLRFGLLCLSSLLFSSSYNMLIPELPGYLSGLGGSKYIGLIIALFTLTAGFSRPFSGLLTDKIGRKPVMIFGASVCIICGFLYPVLTTVAGFLFLRLVHGFSTGFTPTAIAAYVADVVPAQRWGEAFGIQGVFFTCGLALGPAIGSTIKLHYSYDVLFHSSSAMALLSIVLIYRLRETLVNKKQFALSMLKISSRDIISLEVMTPAVITFLSYFAFGMVLTLIPDWSDYLGIRNKGSFFIVFTIASLTIRFLAGKVSDRMGRKIVTITGLFMLCCALVLMAFYQTTNGLMVAAALYGLAAGILSPALNAWTVDLSPEDQRGKGIATMFIALEAGIGLGALLCGWYYQDNYGNIPITMNACALIAFAGLIFLLFKKERSKIDSVD